MFRVFSQSVCPQRLGFVWSRGAPPRFLGATVLQAALMPDPEGEIDFRLWTDVDRLDPEAGRAKPPSPTPWVRRTKDAREGWARKAARGEV